MKISRSITIGYFSDCCTRTKRSALFAASSHVIYRAVARLSKDAIRESRARSYHHDASPDYRGKRGSLQRGRGRVAVGLPGGFRDDIRLEASYGAYIYAIAGSVGVGDVMLAAGDVATVRDATELSIFGDGTAHALVVVVPLRDYAQPAGPTLLAPAGAQ